MADYIKLPNRDVVTFATELASEAEIEQYLFNDIGGIELINLVRNDSVTGIKENYTIISDLKEVQAAFDPTFLLTSRRRGQSDFDQYAIRLSSRIPEENFYEENDIKPAYNVGTNTYYDTDNKELIIELQNMRDGEFVEVEVLSDGKIYTMRENDY